MTLPILPSTTDIRTITERVNPLIKNYNREDTRVPLYALDTGSATAYAIAPIPGIEQYIVGQIFAFKAANANSGTAPTLAVNGLTAGTITYPDGSALVPGDIAANGFYFVQVASTTPTFHLMSSTGGRSKHLQTVSTVTGAVATGTTLVPADNTKPQNNEGDQYMSLSITPKSAASKLRVDVTVFGSPSVNGYVMASLFQDNGADALATGTDSPGVGGATHINFSYEMTSGSTSATTFKVRVGLQAAGTFTFNGNGGVALFGGAYASSIFITERLP